MKIKRITYSEMVSMPPVLLTNLEAGHIRLLGIFYKKRYRIYDDYKRMEIVIEYE